MRHFIPVHIGMRRLDPENLFRPINQISKFINDRLLKGKRGIGEVKRGGMGECRPREGGR